MAKLTIVQDAVLEWFDGERARIVTSQPATPGEEVVMLFRMRDGAPIRCVMHVRSSTPALQDALRGYRLELAMVDGQPVPDVPFVADL